ncbi:MAG TPA: ankyrin repeat domain-containing protein [Bryobacteraceae bacterium]|jgi:ankyrin repeat protein
MKNLIALALLLPFSVAAAISPVADAAAKGDKPALRALLQKKADVNAPQGDGATALMWASYRDDSEMADLLLAAGANPKAANREGATALSLASINGGATMIERLLKAGADVNEKGPHGETPLMFAARNGNVAAMKALLNRKADVNAKEMLRGTTALMWAAEQGHAPAVKLLLDNKANVAAASNPDAKGGTAYLAPPIQSRLASEQGGGRGGRGRGARSQPPAGASAAGEDIIAAADAAAAQAAFGRQQNSNGGGLTSLVFAVRQGDFDTVKTLVDAGADVNQSTNYGWSPLLTATQNRHYRMGTYLLDHGANPNIANKGGWTPLYIATDNRNIEGGDYPVPAPDMDHLDFIKALLSHGANVNARVCGSASTATDCKGDSTETRTIFTMQWLYEDGATPFWRASQSGDLVLMKLLLSRGADPKIATAHNVTPLAVASGIGWVEGITFEWSEAENIEAVKLCLDLGIDPNIHDDEGRVALHGAAHKGRNEVVKLLVDHGAQLDAHDLGSRDTVNGAMVGVTWIPLHYSQGLVRVGVQSAIAHPETEALLRDLMKQRGLPIPADITSSICLTKGVNGCQ